MDDRLFSFARKFSFDQKDQSMEESLYSYMNQRDDEDYVEILGRNGQITEKNLKFVLLLYRNIIIVEFPGNRDV